MRNNITKTLIYFLSLHPELVSKNINSKTVVENLLTCHTPSNHLLVLALASAALQYVDWQAIEETIESLTEDQ